MFGSTKKQPADLTVAQQRVDETREAWDKFIECVERMNKEIDCSVSIRSGRRWADCIYRVDRETTMSIEIKV